jgi:hypothetical protein
MMKIGNIEFGERPLFLAPMEDVTDIGFRMLCKRFGAAMVYTEFVSAEALIRDNKAGLITSADDFVESMGWQTVTRQSEAVERQLFPDLTADEQAIVSQLQQTNDLQLNILSVKTNIPIGQLTALLFQLEMKGVVRSMAGGSYHLLS